MIILKLIILKIIKLKIKHFCLLCITNVSGKYSTCLFYMFLLSLTTVLVNLTKSEELKTGDGRTGERK